LENLLVVFKFSKYYPDFKNKSWSSIWYSNLFSCNPQQSLRVLSKNENRNLKYGNRFGLIFTINVQKIGHKTTNIKLILSIQKFYRKKTRRGRLPKWHHLLWCSLLNWFLGICAFVVGRFCLQSMKWRIGSLLYWSEDWWNELDGAL
jgi:hypothetical protein